MTQETNNSPARNMKNQQRYADFVLSLKNWIELHIEESLSQEDIAYRSGYSPRHLQRIFKGQTGIPLMTYVRLLKLEKIKTLISEENTTLKSLSFKFSFDSQQTFHRAFKRAYGQSPGAYRQSVKITYR